MLHRIEPLRDAGGAIVRRFGTSIEIEGLERTQHELQELKDRLHEENVALRDEITQVSMFVEIVGSSAPLRRVLSLVTKVAGTDSTVLVTGETGTGKELVVRAIHRRFPRASRPFRLGVLRRDPPVAGPLGAVPAREGAFTWALQRRLGRFELALAWTIFLDEVGELPPEAQVALLRVPRERTIERVGGGRPIEVDVRVIAATNRDFDGATAEGTFRSDLYCRPSVLPLARPPLRERAEDLPLRVESLAGRSAALLTEKITGVSRGAKELLTRNDWPGNVRELQNVIGREVILCDRDTLAVDESWLRHPLPGRTGSRLARPSVRVEMRMVEGALTPARGRAAGPDGAARKLGTPRSTPESRIRALRIDKNRFRTAS